MAVASRAGVQLAELGEFGFYRGRVGLAAALRAHGVAAGDEVIVQAFTCLAVPEAVLSTGATPKFADIERGGYNIDPQSLKERLTPRTRAVVIQHTFGIPADVAAIQQVLAGHDVLVIEDCCHTYDSVAAGRLVGTFGAAAFYSFEWGKPMVLGIGGGLVCNEPELKKRVAAAYRSYSEPPASGQLRLELQYHAFQVLYRPSLYWPVRKAFRKLSSAGVTEGNFHDERGWESADYSYRMAPILKRRLSRKFSRLADFRRSSDAAVARYRTVLADASAAHPEIRNGDVPVFARYPLRVSDKPGLLKAAVEAGAEIADWYLTPVHPVPIDQSAAIGLDTLECPEACRRVAEIVSLPTNQRVRERDIERIALAFRLVSGA